MQSIHHSAGDVPAQLLTQVTRNASRSRAGFFVTWLRAGSGPLIHPCTVVQTFPAVVGMVDGVE